MNEGKLVEHFLDEGYVVVPGLFGADEIERIQAHFMQLNAQGHGYVGDRSTLLGADDPLAAYPRLVHPHRFDKLSLDWLLDERLRQWTTALLGAQPYAAQTMFYFKPPGARGQALHQDQKSLRVRPGTCLAAWMAVDDCDEDNGCMQIVPRTQDLPQLCLIDADLSVSFSSRTVPIPPGSAPQPIPMRAGDVLFFNGQVIHGSYPNRSQTRFRRSLIGHYVVGEARQVAEFYHPLLRFNGDEVRLEGSEAGGPCGIFVDEDEPAIMMVAP
ncbi:MAG: phytanoyl-CoA dioxygenase family protein [Chloroflexi bacterium]|nr:phytanoyl-CoA dioxygenase family protein [Chloroflexota bacterium]MDE2650677.1 phytanoyl-CoA dioxygenase family protein [Chloroflexota bacterium]MXV91958.1 phytanoyl-CoA dioxygenase family protein [Chloroflexota bacterium]MXX83724.1 phytanoyl-CoA dioxygenase family protein [Chloroflexota bacterium]MYA94243.1 phytanoyl-CoA dioxygenase family protein [Chloroflexota bacterium]